MIDFIIEHFFTLAKSLFILGVLFVIFAAYSKGKSNRQSGVSEDSGALINAEASNTEVQKNNSGKLMTAGKVAMSIGAAMFLVGALAIGFVIYAIIQFIAMISQWG